MPELNPSTQTARLHLGAAYYPEHWPEERWPDEVHLMQAAGLSAVRMAEFAWSTLEPAAGEFNFDWLERAINLLAAAGIKTILGTPTAAPPAWLVQASPDLLAVDESGRRVQFGNRCHYCVNSPELHRATQRLVGTMAERFGRHPQVIGWQIDNEFNRVCYCERCQRLFQQYLEQRFGTLQALNADWTTSYWSQTYSAWEQIPLPIGAHNPGLMLAFKQFITHSYRAFQKLQVDLLRPHLKAGDWITHNFMGWYDGYDHYEMAADLDLAAWDWYVGSGHHDYLVSGAAHDLTRGFKQRNFWLIETQPGSVNWAARNNMLDKGEGRAMAWHAVAHGADGISYWQWRSALGGQEQYHGSLVDQSGQSRPFYSEAQQLGTEFKAVSGLLACSQVKSEVALLNCYDSRWSIQWQRHTADFDVVAHFNAYYRPLAARNVNLDVISADAPLAGYKMVVAPVLLVLKGQRAEHLKDFVRRGGRLVLTLRSGMKDEFNALLPMRQPGALAELAGMEVEEYYALLDPIPVSGFLFAGEGKIWAEKLKLLDARQTVPLAHYGEANGWLDGGIAVAVHPYGQGWVYTVGTWLDDASQQALMEHILEDAGIHGMPAAAGIEIRTRCSPAGEEITFVINHLRKEQRFALPWPAQEHLSGKRVSGEMVLPAYGVAILTRG